MENTCYLHEAINTKLTYGFCRHILIAENFVYESLFRKNFWQKLGRTLNLLPQSEKKRNYFPIIGNIPNSSDMW